MLGRMEAYARQLHVEIELGARVDRLPEPPVIVATSLEAARQLLGDHTLRWQSGRAVLLDVGLRRQRGDPFIVADLDEAGWVERYSLPDPSVAPPGHELLQAQMPLRDGERGVDGLRRLEGLLDLGFPRWRERLAWRRHATASNRTGALDLPGQTWQDRPRVDRGGGVFLAGDMVAAPGLLGEVSCASAVAAARGALRAISDPSRGARQGRRRTPA